MHAILVRDGKREDGKWQGVNKAGLVGRAQIMKLDSVLKPVCLLLLLLGKFLSQTFTYIITFLLYRSLLKDPFLRQLFIISSPLSNLFHEGVYLKYIHAFTFVLFTTLIEYKYQEDKGLIYLFLTWNGAWHMVTA